METQKKEIKHASQVIIRDSKGRFYLEKNSHLGVISFWGGTKEPGDTDEFETALRELKEELGILFSRNELQIIHKDEPRQFPKGIFLSTLFLLEVSDAIAEEIEKNQKCILFTLDEITSSHEEFVLGKEHFLKRIQSIL